MEKVVLDFMLLSKNKSKCLCRWGFYCRAMVKTLANYPLL